MFKGAVAEEEGFLHKSNAILKRESVKKMLKVWCLKPGTAMYKKKL